jgi:hypothetical protein
MFWYQTRLFGVDVWDLGLQLGKIGQLQPLTKRLSLNGYCYLGNNNINNNDILNNKDTTITKTAAAQTNELVPCISVHTATLNGSSLAIMDAQCSFDLFKFLISNGAQINARNDEGWSVLTLQILYRSVFLFCFVSVSVLRLYL